MAGTEGKIKSKCRISKKEKNIDIRRHNTLRLDPRLLCELINNTFNVSFSFHVVREGVLFCLTQTLVCVCDFLLG